MVARGTNLPYQNRKKIRGDITKNVTQVLKNKWFIYSPNIWELFNKYKLGMLSIMAIAE